MLPDQFIGQTTDVRLAEWMILNQPTIECIERYGKKFRLTNKRVLFLKQPLTKNLTLGTQHSVSMFSVNSGG